MRSLLLSCLVVPSLALAAPSEPKEAEDVEVHRGREVTLSDRTQVVNFDEVALSGEIYRPLGEVVLERPRCSAISLLKLRTNFDDAIVSSVAAVK